MSATSSHIAKESAQAERQLITASLHSDNITSLNAVPPEIASHEAPRTQAPSITEVRPNEKDLDFKPERPTVQTLAIKYQIATTLLRFPLTLKKLHKVSTYIPISINYFEVIHYMDTLMANNLYFQRIGLPWHPLISRLYFAEIFLIQTLRAMRHARVGSSATRLYVEQILKDFPPESLPIPGPLVPILQTIATCESDDPLFGPITPLIRNDVGPQTAADLFDFGTTDYVLPNIPLIAGFTNSIIHAQGAIPDYSQLDTFNDEEGHVINGHVFEIDEWQALERTALLSPGLNARIESTPEIDETLHLRGVELDIPVLQGDTPTSGFENYMLMSDNSSWFLNLIDIMSTYCAFFKESTTLGSCSPHGPPCGLVRSRLHYLSSLNANQNIVHNLDHAFPGKYPYALEYEHRSYELSIPHIYQMMGQFASINTSCDYRTLPIWNSINQVNTGRDGPYWLQNPSRLGSRNENNLREVEGLVASHYFIENPLG